MSPLSHSSILLRQQSPQPSQRLSHSRGGHLGQASCASRRVCRPSSVSLQQLPANSRERCCISLVLCRKINQLFSLLPDIGGECVAAEACAMPHSRSGDRRSDGEIDSSGRIRDVPDQEPSAGTAPRRRSAILLLRIDSLDRFHRLERRLPRSPRSGKTSPSSSAASACAAGSASSSNSPAKA